MACGEKHKVSTALLLLLLAVATVTIYGKEKASKRTEAQQSALKKLGQIAATDKEIAKLGAGMKTFRGVGYLTDKFGNAGVNAVTCWLKVQEIGDIFQRIMNGDTEGAAAQMAEAIGTLVLLHIPGTVMPINDFYKEIFEGSKEDTAIHKSMKSLNVKLKRIVRKPGPPGKTISEIGKKMHQFKEGVGDALDTVKSSKPTRKLAEYGSRIKATRGGKLAGKVLTRCGGTINVLTVLYSAYKIGEGAKNGNLDQVLENALVIVGAVLVTVSAYASAGSIFGPLGTIAGVLIGAAACMYGTMKPDPDGKLKEHLKEGNIIGRATVQQLQTDFEFLPAVARNVLGERENDWIFEVNQNFLRVKQTTLTVTAPLEFSWERISSPPGINNEKECRNWRRMDNNGGGRWDTVESGDCMRMGHKRAIDKSDPAYNGHFYKSEGKAYFDQRFDFYGYIYDRPKPLPYTGTIIFVRTDKLEKSDTKIRGFNIDTRLPSWRSSTKKGADTVVLFDLMNLDPDAKININLRGGDDSIIVNGIIGNSISSGIVTDISFHEEKGSNEDVGGMLSFSSMDKVAKKTFANVVHHINGITYYARSENHDGRSLVCYRWKGPGDVCNMVVSPVAVIGTSPLHDIIHFNSENDLIVTNEKRANTYIFTVRPNERVRVHTVIDKSTDSSNIKVKADSDLKAVYIEKEETYEFYRAKRLRLRVIYKGSKETPVVYVPDHSANRFGGEVRLTNLISREILKGTSGLSQDAAAEIVGKKYKYNKNVKSAGAQTAVCLCKVPDGTEKEGYWSMRMETGKLDTLIVSEDFITDMESRELTAKLIYDKVGERERGWVLELRKDGDVRDVLYPRYDIRLENVDLIRSEDGTVLFDLTQPLPLTNEIDLKVRFKNVKEYSLGDDFETDDAVVETDLDDYVYVTGSRSTGPRKKVVDLGTGTNIVVFDVSDLSANLKFKLTKHEIEDELENGAERDVDEEDAFSTDFVVVDSHRKEVVFRNADKVVCQFSNGIQRDLPEFFESEATGSISSLKAACNAIDKGVHGGQSSVEQSAFPNCESACRG